MEQLIFSTQREIDKVWLEAFSLSSPPSLFLFLSHQASINYQINWKSSPSAEHGPERLQELCCDIEAEDNFEYFHDIRVVTSIFFEACWPRERF